MTYNDFTKPPKKKSRKKTTRKSTKLKSKPVSKKSDDDDLVCYYCGKNCNNKLGMLQIHDWYYKGEKRPEKFTDRYMPICPSDECTKKYYEEHPPNSEIDLDKEYVHTPNKWKPKRKSTKKKK